MKKKVVEVRNIFLKIRINKQELQEVKKNQLKITEQSLSNYIRKVSMQKPAIVKYRNQSADDFLKDMLLLKKEISVVGNNFNQAVHNLHLLENIPEFRSWVLQSDALQKSLVVKVEEIKLRMNQLYEQWLQK